MIFIWGIYIPRNKDNLTTCNDAQVLLLHRTRSEIAGRHIGFRTLGDDVFVVARATGGLDDTIDEQPLGGGNGFKFWGYSSSALMEALQRALGAFRNKEEWTQMMQRGMAQNFSWDAPAKEYVRVYERAIQNRS